MKTSSGSTVNKSAAASGAADTSSTSHPGVLRRAWRRVRSWFSRSKAVVATRSVVTRAYRASVNAAVAALRVIKDAFRTFVSALWAGIASVLWALMGAADVVLHVGATAAVAAADVVAPEGSVLRRAGRRVINAVKAVGSRIHNAVKAVVYTVATVAVAILIPVGTVFVAAIGGVFAIIGTAWNLIRHPLSAVGTIIAFVGGVLATGVELVALVLRTAIRLITAALNLVSDVLWGSSVKSRDNLVALCKVPDSVREAYEEACTEMPDLDLNVEFKHVFHAGDIVTDTHMDDSAAAEGVAS